VDIRDKVREFFQERNEGDSDEITCTVDDVNELLRSIGSDELKRLWTVMALLTLQSQISLHPMKKKQMTMYMNELSVELSGDAELDDWSVDSRYRTSNNLSDTICLLRWAGV
jgi:hypothetical protein